MFILGPTNTLGVFWLLKNFYKSKLYSVLNKTVVLSISIVATTKKLIHQSPVW